MFCDLSLEITAGAGLDILIFDLNFPIDYIFKPGKDGGGD